MPIYIIKDLEQTVSSRDCSLLIIIPKYEHQAVPSTSIFSTLLFWTFFLHPPLNKFHFSLLQLFSFLLLLALPFRHHYSHHELRHSDPKLVGRHRPAAPFKLQETPFFLHTPFLPQPISSPPYPHIGIANPKNTTVYCRKLDNVRNVEPFNVSLTVSLPLTGYSWYYQCSRCL